MGLGIWSNSYKLPENVKTPYTLLAVTKEGTPYLITIVEIKTDGIEIVYRKLNVEEAKMYMDEFPDNAVEARSPSDNPMAPQTTSRNWDFELKNGSGFWGRRFIAGARYEHTTYQIFMSGSTWPTIDKS